MDVRQLLLLAGDNSALAKKKVDRLTAQDGDDEPKISGDAVAAYLAKQKAFKDKIKAQEEEARKKRIQARLDASLGKPTRKEKKLAEKEKAASGHFLPGDKRTIDVVKEKKKEVKLQKREKEEKTRSDHSRSHNNHRTRSPSPECPAPKKKKTDKEKRKSESSKVKTKEKTVEVDDENTHRKYRRRTADTFESSIHEEKLKEKEKNALLSKEKNSKKVNKASNSNSSSNLSFTDLLQLAKTNASSARLADDGTLIKKKEKGKTFDEEHYSCDKSKSKDDSYESMRSMQKKLKSKDDSHDNHKKSKHKDNYDESSSKSKHAHNSSHNNHNHHHTKSKHREEEVRLKSKHVNGNDNHKKSRYNDDYDEISRRSKHHSVNDMNQKDKKKIHNGSSESHHHSKKSLKECYDKAEKTGKERLVNGHNLSKHRNEKESDIYSKQFKHSKVKNSVKENRYAEDSPSPKRGLIAQTISTKKNGTVEPPDKISKVFKQVKPSHPVGIEAQYRGVKPSGIEAQFMKKGSQRPKMKKRPVAKRDDFEDEFEKEAKMLARKRKLFEMQRITGNSNLVEEDIISDYEDYDLSEEEEDDDDFIDDSEAVQDVSKYIRKITGYDRRLYDDSDDDDRNMESSYSQIEKEEARSARIAREEDRIAALEEAAELAREKAKEAAKKKKLAKR